MVRETKFRSKSSREARFIQISLNSRSLLGVLDQSIDVIRLDWRFFPWNGKERRFLSTVHQVF